MWSSSVDYSQHANIRGSNSYSMIGAYDGATCGRYNSSGLVDINYCTDMSYMYANRYTINSSPRIYNGVLSISHAYQYCYNITGAPVCSNNVINMSYAYSYCYNLNGSPVCGNNVINMASAYYSCQNLTGSPVCGSNIINMSGAYYSCRKLTGSPVCGDNVVNMYQAYLNCSNLTSINRISKNVVNMCSCFYECTNISGTAILPKTVNNAHTAFYNCGKIQNVIIQSLKLDLYRTFYGNRSSNRLNVLFTDKNAYQNAIANKSNIFNYYFNTESDIADTIRIGSGNFTITNTCGGPLINVYYGTPVWDVIGIQPYCSNKYIKASEQCHIDYKYIIDGDNGDQINQDQVGMTYSATGPATITQDGDLIVNSDAQVDDVITVTATSTYNTDLSGTTQLIVKDKFIEVPGYFTFIEHVNSGSYANYDRYRCILSDPDSGSVRSTVQIKVFGGSSISVASNETIFVYQLDQTSGIASYGSTQNFTLDGELHSINFYKTYQYYTSFDVFIKHI